MVILGHQVTFLAGACLTFKQSQSPTIPEVAGSGCMFDFLKILNKQL